MAVPGIAEIANFEPKVADWVIDIDHHQKFEQSPQLSCILSLLRPCRCRLWCSGRKRSTTRQVAARGCAWLRLLSTHTSWFSHT